MGSCWAISKRELERAEYERVAAARAAAAEYVRYDRFERKHSSPGYLTPNQFETQDLAKR